MHGLIFVEHQKYVDSKLGGDALIMPPAGHASESHASTLCGGLCPLIESQLWCS